MLKFTSLRYLSLLLVLGSLEASTPQKSSVCHSLIYCTGKILHVLQRAKILPSSKILVDLKLRRSEEEILQSFDTLMTETYTKPNDMQLMSFLAYHFEDKEELSYWHPPDFDPKPVILQQIRNPKLLELAKDIINIWPKVGRILPADVVQNPQESSLIYVPNGFIVPSVQTKELYYWDSYWIIRGLLISNMPITAKGMIENFLHLVVTYGYIPQGNRIYYLGRSQPPLLTWMVFDYFNVTGDKSWLKQIITIAETELKYWLDNKIVTVELKGKKYSLLRYVSNINSKGPRPECYNEDYENAQYFDPRKREVFYAQRKSTTESGWDLSSRWIIGSASEAELNITNIKTKQVLPVDLNSIFAGSLQKIGDLREILGSTKSARNWWRLADQWREAIENILWDVEDGIWYDFDSIKMKRRKEFFLSCAAPLWANAVEPRQAPERAKYFLRYLHTNGVLQFPGGVPTSLYHTGADWDYPNAWPPLQAMLIGALENIESSEAKQIAKKQIEICVRAIYLGYKKWNKMFDSYNCMSVGDRGASGEYVHQYGYGWTNGYILELLQRYGHKLNV